jgi:putative transposase
MAAPHSVDPVQLPEKHLASASPDLLREMVAVFANAMMSAQADQACGAGYGQRSAERANQRNGYRAREWDTRVGTVELGPEVAGGPYYPDWLLTHRRRAEQLGSKTCHARRSARWQRSWMPRSRLFVSDHWMPARTPSCGPMR